MRTFKASIQDYRVICESDNHSCSPIPLLRDNDGDHIIHCLSPIHGRSFVLKQGQTYKPWTIGKGNGLSYTNKPLVKTTPDFTDTWGGLTLDSAIRDFKICMEVNQLGIQTNRMDYVLELDFDILQNGNSQRAALLQYSVQCPYRISDYGFVPRLVMQDAITSWKALTTKSYNDRYLIAADVLLRNLRIMHDNNIMHNALHPQNYTWALELLDFEASRSDKCPYSSSEYETNVAYLFDMEILQTYEVINYIAWCLGEKINYATLDRLFEEYGFGINEL